MPATLTPTTPTPRKAFERALARCLDPVTAPTFLAEHWERLPLVVPRDEPGRFDDLLSEADVERLVCATAIRYPAFRLVREGGQLAVSDYASDVSWRPPFTGTADVPRVLAEWEAGATIVLQALHVNWHPLAVFCRLLEEALGYGVQANAYYTPRGSQGFGVHHDTHDVLVLQVAGEKTWLLYDPLLELPLKHQRYTRLSASTASRPRPRPPGRGHPLPAARLAPRSGDVRHGLAPPDDRDRGPHLASTRSKDALTGLEGEVSLRRAARPAASTARSTSSRAARSRTGRGAPAAALRRHAPADPGGRADPAPRARRGWIRAPASSAARR